MYQVEVLNTGTVVTSAVYRVIKTDTLSDPVMPEGSDATERPAFLMSVHLRKAAGLMFYHHLLICASSDPGLQGKTKLLTSSNN